MKLKVDKEKIDIKSFLSEKLKISKNNAKKIIDTRCVFVNDKRIWIASYNLYKNDIVEIPDNFNNKSKNHIKIIYEDDYVIALEKPYNLITNNQLNSVENLLKKELNNENLKAIHRLDKDTTGILLFAKNNEIFDKFKKLWQEKIIEKIYLAICYGVANFEKKIIKLPIDNKYAESLIEKIKTNNKLTLFKITTKTGRKHQIRIHLSKIGHPILGDKIYGPNIIKDENFKKVKRQLLHAFLLSYTCPFTNKKITIKSEYPSDFKNFFKGENL